MAHHDNDLTKDEGQEYIEESSNNDTEVVPGAVPVEGEAVVRLKIDLILLPIITFSYMLSYIDKVALSNAAVLGLLKDNHLVGQQYSWASSIFYFGYLIGTWPSTVLMQKLHIGRFLGVMITAWGVVTTCMAATDSFAKLATTRFFLGLFESALTPVLTILVSQYYKRTEQPLRQCIWWSGSAVGSFVLDGVAYAVSGKNVDTSKYHFWQILFLIFGPISMFWGLILFLSIPSEPGKAWFLTKTERHIASARWLSNQTSAPDKKYKSYQAIECLKDPQAWMLTSLAFLQCIVGGGLTSFGRIVYTDLGYTGHTAAKAAFPGDGIHLGSVIVCGVIALYWAHTRMLTSILTNIIVLVGACLVGSLPSSQNNARLAGLYICYVNTVTYIMVMSLIGSNVAGQTKRGTCSAMVFIGYAVGQIIAPQLFRSDEAPRYRTGFRAFYVSTALMIVIAVALILYYTLLNRKRDRNERGSQIEHDGDDTEPLDLTDWQQRHFRYLF